MTLRAHTYNDVLVCAKVFKRVACMICVTVRARARVIVVRVCAYAHYILCKV